MKDPLMINTKTLEKMVNDASGRNRSVYEKEFLGAVVQNGLHLINFTMIHNDIEMRCQLFCKMKNRLHPAEIWLDVSIEVYNAAVENSKMLDNALSRLMQYAQQ